jgi:hypothetical protein
MIVRLGVVASAVLSFSLSAQTRASELGSMSQVIDGTRITVEYSRPRSRGRDSIFGTKTIHWDKVWTPGANAATTLEVDKPVRINGMAVAKGKYSVWMVVRKSGDWTVVLDPRFRLWHTRPPDSASTQVRVPVRVETVPFTDVLTWSMPELRMSGGTLVMQWERVRVPMKIDVESTLVTTVPASEAAQYLGEWSFAELDSAGTPTRALVLTITYEGGTLKGRWTPDDPVLKTFAMVSIGPDSFAPGVYDKGEIYEVLKPDMTFEFSRENGRAVSFLIRDMEDNVRGKGKRKP